MYVRQINDPEQVLEWVTALPKDFPLHKPRWFFIDNFIGGRCQCVAIFDDKGEWTGFALYQMDKFLTCHINLIQVTNSFREACQVFEVEAIKLGALQIQFVTEKPAQWERLWPGCRAALTIVKKELRNESNNEISDQHDDGESARPGIV